MAINGKKIILILKCIRNIPQKVRSSEIVTIFL